MKILIIGLLTLFVFGGCSRTEDTMDDMADSAEETMNDMKRGTDKVVRDAKEEVCEMVDGKLQCRVEEIQHDVEDGADEVEDYTE